MITEESPAEVSQPSAAGEQVQNDYSAFLGPPSVEADLSEESPAPGGEEAEGEQEPETEAPAETPAEEPAETEAEPERGGCCRTQKLLKT